MTIEKSTDKLLYKFSPPNNYGVLNLTNGTLYCQHHEGFNDPFEFWTDIVDGVPNIDSDRDRFFAALKEWGFEEKDLGFVIEDYEEYFDSIKDLQPPFQLMKNKTRICCFSSSADNLLMWSHYADGLRGFCLVLDADAVIESKPEAYLTEVAYLERPPIVDAFVYAVASDQYDFHMMAAHEAQGCEAYEEVAEVAMSNMKKMWAHTFAIKPTEWKYEQEQRLLITTEVDAQEAVLLNYPVAALKEVIIGERMDLAQQNELIEIVREKYPAAILSRASRANDEFKIISTVIVK